MDYIIVQKPRIHDIFGGLKVRLWIFGEGISHLWERYVSYRNRSCHEWEP